MSTRKTDTAVCLRLIERNYYTGWMRKTHQPVGLNREKQRHTMSISPKLGEFNQ